MSNMEDLSNVPSVAKLFEMISNESDREIAIEIFERTFQECFSQQSKQNNFKSQVWELSEAIRLFQVNNQVKDDTVLGSLCWNIRNYIGWINKGVQSDLEVHIGKDTDYKSGQEQYEYKLSRILENIKTKKGGAK
jgi:hypothetical protein